MSNKFYLDVFNQLLKFNDEEIFIVFDSSGEIWFKYGDVLKVVGYTHVKQAIKDINIDIKYIKTLQEVLEG